ncbi:MAG: DUF2203 family protein [SAR202 cluster bacterium]|nr:DUF2203 family protein [SAR202 cluster bacterium]|tara:strand:+ start:10619 stop:11017 length:399 start_codon:yes stop_codon:yes gene_type:complete
MARYFSLEEAQELVSWLKEIFNYLNPLLQQSDELNDSIEQLQNPVVSNGLDDVVVDRITFMSSELNRIFSEVNEKIELIHQRGILVKNLQQGLVDFPYMYENREVYLCWHVGENEIKYWHEINTGFAGRNLL